MKKTNCVIYILLQLLCFQTAYALASSREVTNINNSWNMLKETTWEPSW